MHATLATQTLVTITMTEQDALNLLAVCGRVGGMADKGRGTFTDRTDSLALVLRETLGLGMNNPTDVTSGSIVFERPATPDDFRFDFHEDAWETQYDNPPF